MKKRKSDLDRTCDIVKLIEKEKKEYDIDDLLKDEPEKIQLKESNLTSISENTKKIDKSKLEKSPTSNLKQLVDEKKENDFISKIKTTKEENKPSNKRFHLFLSLLFTVMILLSFAYIGYTLFKFDDSSDQMKMILNSVILFVMSFSLILTYACQKVRNKRIFTCIGTLCLSGFFLFNILVDFNILHLPENRVVPDFSNETIEKAMNWAEENNIDVTQIYDSSDQIEEYHVITQDVKPNTSTRDVDKITFTVSEGPDYNKEVSIANMIGWNIDDAIEEIEENLLNNVTVDYELNVETNRDVIFFQNRNGQMKRNDELKLTVSLGDGSDLQPVELEDFSNEKLLTASVWLERHGILYEVSYEFSDTVSRGKIIRQSIKKGTTVTPNEDKVTLIVSKGKKIIVPDLSKMSIQEATNWVVSNKLKVSFYEKYHATIEKGYIIEANYKENDVIEEGTMIEITSSKGSLLMKSFDNIQDFRTWASEHDIKIQEEYEQSTSVEKGKIIRFSVEEGTPVNTGDVITVYISNGSTIIVPNFVGKTKSEIESSCKNLGLNCTFTYGGNSSYNKDIAISQNKKANSEVIPDTYVNIVLSSGKTSTTTNSGSTNNTQNNNSTNNNTSTSTPTPTPSCNTKTFYIQPTWIIINDPEATCKNIKDNNTGYNFTCNYVESDSGRKGQVLNSGTLNGSTINSCNTVTLNIKNN